VTNINSFDAAGDYSWPLGRVWQATIFTLTHLVRQSTDVTCIRYWKTET